MKKQLIEIVFDYGDKAERKLFTPQEILEMSETLKISAEEVLNRLIDGEKNEQREQKPVTEFLRKLSKRVHEENPKADCLVVSESVFNKYLLEKEGLSFPSPVSVQFSEGIDITFSKGLSEYAYMAGQVEKGEV